MLMCKLENPHITKMGPIMEINLYKEDGTKSEYRAAIAPWRESNFICYRIYNGEVTQSSIGHSGIFPFRKMIKSDMLVKYKKSIIHGQIAISIIDFIGVISNLMGEDILNPEELSLRFITPELRTYINLCYKYFKEL